jgi:hypothetical protein
MISQKKVQPECSITLSRDEDTLFIPVDLGMVAVIFINSLRCSPKGSDIGTMND